MENDGSLVYENNDFNNMEREVEQLMRLGYCNPTQLELRHICRNGFGDMQDAQENVKKLANQMKEAKYRALILAAPGS